MRVVFRRQSVNSPSFNLCLHPESFHGMMLVTRTYNQQEEVLVNIGSGELAIVRERMATDWG